MSKAYSDDLRFRIVRAVEDEGMSQSAAAVRFAVGLASVKRYLRQWRTTRDLAPRPHPGRPRAIPPAAQDRLVAHLAGKVRKQIRLDRAVVELIPTDPAGKRGVDVVAVSTKDDRVVGYHADQVIFAAPQFLRRYLLRHERQSPPRELSALE